MRKKAIPVLLGTLLALFSSFYATSSVSGQTVVATIPVGMSPSAIDATSSVSGQTVVATIPVGMSPSAIDVNIATNEIWVENSASNTTSVINGTTNTVVATIHVGPSPQGLGRFVNHVTNRIYVSNSGGRNVTVIDGATKSVLTTIGALPCSPVGVAVNEATNRIYVACTFGPGNGGFVVVIDGATNTVVANIDNMGGTFSPEDVAVNPVTNRIYVTDRDRNNHDYVNVIDGATNTPIATVCGGSTCNAGGGPLDVDSTTNRVYSSSNFCFFRNYVAAIDGSTNTLITDVNVGFCPFGVGVNEATNKIYVANSENNSVSMVDGSTNAMVATVPLSAASSGVAVNPLTNLVYVTEPQANQVAIISGPETRVSTSTSVSCSPSSVVTNQTTSCTATVMDTSPTPTSPTGTVSFSSNSSSSFSPSNRCKLASTGSSTGSCSVSYTPRPGSEGTHVITGAYIGDSDHSGSLGSFSLTVIPPPKDNTSTMVSCASPITVGGSSTCNAMVSDTTTPSNTPTGGTVSFTLNAGTTGGHLSAMTCTLSAGSCPVSFIGSTATGTASVTASYGGDSTHNASPVSAASTITVKRTTSTIVSCSKAKGGIVCTATVTDTSPGTPATPTGTVAWKTSGTGTFSPNPCTLSGSGSSATCTVNYTPVEGIDASIITITGTYNGDTDHSGSSGSTTIKSSS